MPDWSYTDGQSLSLLTTQGGAFASVQLSDGTPVHLIWDVSPNTDDRTHWYLLCGSALRNAITLVASGTLVGKPAAFFAQSLNGAGGMTQAFDLVVDGSDNLYVFLPPYFFDTAGIGNIYASVIPFAKGVGHAWTQGTAQNLTAIGQPSSTFSSGGSPITSVWSSITSTAAFPATGYLATLGSGAVPVLVRYQALQSATSLLTMAAVAGFTTGINTVAGAAIVDPVTALHGVWVNAGGGAGGGYLLLTWTDSGGTNGYATIDAGALLAGTLTIGATAANPAFLGSGSGAPAPGVALAPSQFGAASGLAAAALASNVVYRNSQNTNNTAAGTSLTITTPTGTAAGDCLLAFIQVNQNAAALTLNAPAGWTLLATQWPGLGAGPNVYVYTKTATAAEPANYTWTWTGSVANSGVVTAYNTQGMGVTATAAITETSSTTVNYPATPVAAASATPVAVVYAALANNATTPTLTVPFGTTSRVTFANTTNAFAFFLDDQVVGAPTKAAVTGTLSGSSVNWGITVGFVPVASPVAVGAWAVASGGTLSTNTLVSASGAGYPSTASAQPVPSVSAVSPGNYLVAYAAPSGAVQADVATTAAYHIGSASPAVIGIPAFGKSLSPGGQVYSDPVIPNQAWLTYIDTVTLVTRKLRVLANASATSVTWDAAAQSFDAAYPAAATVANLRVTPAPRAGIVDAIFTNSTASPVSVTGDHATLGPTPAAPVLTAPAYGAVADLAAGQPFAWTPDPANTERGLAFVRQAPGGTTEFFTGLQNLLSANDASFEGGIGSWNAGGSAAQTTAQALDGSHSLAATAPGSSGTYFINTFPYSVYPASPGVTYTGLNFIRAAVTGRSCFTYLQWCGPTGTVLGISPGSAATDTTTGWTMLTCSGQAPAGTAYVQLVIEVQSAAASEVHYVDCAGIFPGVPGFELVLASMAPVGWWKLGNPVSGIEADSSGRGLGLTVTGGVTPAQPSLVATYPAATSDLFDGSTGFLSAAASAALQLSTNFGLYARFKTTAGSSGTMLTLATVGTAPANTWWRLVTTPTGQVRLSDGTNQITTVASFNDGAVHDVLVVVGSPATFANMVIYVDGVAQATTTTGTWAPGNPASPNIRIGVSGGGGTLFFSGTLDEAAVFNFAPSAAQALALSQAATVNGWYVQGWTPGGLSSWSAAEDWILTESSQSITFPPGLWADNDTAYTWWVQTMSALLVPSPAPFPFAVTGSAPPTATPSAINIASSTPTLSFTYSPGTPTAVLASYEWKVGPSGWNPASTPATADSGVITAGAPAPWTTPQLSQGAWDAYLTILTNDGATSTTKLSFTIAYTALSTPAVAVVAGTDATSGAPAAKLTVTWVLGAMSGSVIVVVTRSDGLVLRSQPTVAASALTATVEDAEVALNQAYTYTAVLQQVGASGTLLSATSAASGSVTVGGDRRPWLHVPSNPAGAIPLWIKSMGSTKRSISQGVFAGLGSDTEIVVTDVRRKRTGTLTIATPDVNTSAQLAAFINANPEQVLLLRRPSKDPAAPGMVMYFLAIGDESEGPVANLNSKERLVSFSFVEQPVP